MPGIRADTSLWSNCRVIGRKCRKASLSVKLKCAPIIMRILQFFYCIIYNFILWNWSVEWKKRLRRGYLHTRTIRKLTVLFCITRMLQIRSEGLSLSKVIQPIRSQGLSLSKVIQPIRSQGLYLSKVIQPIRSEGLYLSKVIQPIRREGLYLSKVIQPIRSEGISLSKDIEPIRSDQYYFHYLGREATSFTF